MKAKRQVYEDRIKQAIARTGNIHLFPEPNIPKTTAKNWLHSGVGNVVANTAFDLDREALELKCFELEERVKSLQARLTLLRFVSVTMGLSRSVSKICGRGEETNH